MRWSSSFMLVALATLVACATPGRATKPTPVDGGDDLGPIAATVVDTPLRPPARTAMAQSVAPFALHTRSGASLPISSLQVRAFDRDPLALTELRFSFDRAEPRATSGRFEARLPEGARIVRFAVGHEGRWREAQVTARTTGAAGASVASSKGARDSQVSLGWRADDDVFVAELPHVPARGPVSIVLSYVQTNETAQPVYRLPLAGLPRVGAFDARVVGIEDDEGSAVHEVQHSSWVPEDLVVARDIARSAGVRHGELAVARVRALHHDHRAPMHGLTILFDTSASRALGYDAQIERLAGLLEALSSRAGEDLRVRLVAFDQRAETVFEGELGDLDEQVFDLLRNRRALGASDLGAALYYVGLRHGGEFDRLLVVSDGRVTAGRDGDALVSSAQSRLADAGFRRVDVMVDGTVRDDASLDALVGLLPERGLVLDDAQPVRESSQRLLRSVSELQVSVPGALWSYPETVRDVQASDEILVFAQMPAGDVGDTMDVVFADEVHPRPWESRVPLVAVERGLVDDAVAHARVASLEDALWHASGLPAIYRQKYWSQIVELSRRHRLLNDFTTLHVPRDGTPRPDVGPMLVAGPSEVMQVRATDPEIETADGTVVAVPEIPSRPLTTAQLLLLADEETRERRVSNVVAREDRQALDRAVAAAGATDAPRPNVASSDEASDLVASMRRDVQLVVDEVHPAPPSPTRSWRGRGIGSGRAPRRAMEDAYSGNLLAVMNLLQWNRADQAHELAVAWHEADPGDVMAVVALGEALEAEDDVEGAARAYGSILDLYPDRPDMRRFAGARLEGLDRRAQRLALDAYRVAREQDFDTPDNHRRLAYALLRDGQHARAFEVLARSIARYLASSDQKLAPEDKLLREDLGLIGAAWIAAEPDRRHHVLARLRQVGCVLESEPSLRFVLSWETSGRDVDLHVRDGQGGHAYYDSPSLGSGGLLYGDAKGRSGTEALTVSGTPTAYPYHIEAHVHATGPDGFGSGRLQIIEHDGQGHLRFSERPFVVSRDRAFVDLGVVEGPLADSTRDTMISTR